MPDDAPPGPSTQASAPQAPGRLAREDATNFGTRTLEVPPKSPTGPLAPMRPVASPLRGGPFLRAFCAPRVRIANARAPVFPTPRNPRVSRGPRVGGPGAFGPPGPQMPRPGFRPHL